MIALLIIFLLFVFVVIGLYLFKFFNVENVENYNLFNNCENYRLGDIFFDRIQLEKKENSSQDTKYEINNFIINKYPDSICTNYIKRHLKKYDYKTLFKIINEKIKENDVEKEDAVLHIRTGDILDHPFYENSKKLIDNKLDNNDPSDETIKFKKIKVKYNNKVFDRVENPNIYLKSLMYYKKIIDKLHEININNILIISGSHIKCKNYKLSSYVINKIKNLFEKNNIKVKLELGNHPDIDLIKVINSKNFIPSKGGYSDLLSDLAKIKKVNILK